MGRWRPENEFSAPGGIIRGGFAPPVEADAVLTPRNVLQVVPLLRELPKQLACIPAGGDACHPFTADCP
jgi:hypothetical protein